MSDVLTLPMTASHGYPTAAQYRGPTKLFKTAYLMRGEP